MTWQPKPEALERQANDQNERDWQTTVEVMRLAVQSFGSTAPKTDEELQRRCEALWQWAKADEWKP